MNLQSTRHPLSSRSCFFGFFLSLFVLIVFAHPAFASNDVKSIRVGVFDFKPLIFTDDDNVVRGINADLLNQVAKERGWDVLYVKGSWQEGLARIKEEKLDLITSVMYTEERAKYLDYSKQAILTVWGEVYLLPEADIENILDLEGKDVAIMRGDHSGEEFRKLAQKFGINCNFVEAASHNDVFALIKEKKVTAGVAPNIFGIINASRYGLLRSSIVFSPNPLYFASHKGANKDLLADIDKSLTLWKKDKESYYYKTLNSWLGLSSKKNSVIPQWVFYALGGVTGLVFFLLLWGRTLRLQVQKRTKELSESETKFKTLADNSPLAIYLSEGVEQKAQYINPTFTKLFGYTMDDVPSVDKWWPLAYPNEKYRQAVAEEWQRKVTAALNNESEIEPMETIVTCKDGSTKNIVWGYTATRKQSWAFGLDITERTRLLEEQARSAQLAALGTVAAGVAHEINNPIQGIMNYAGLIERAPDNSERNLEFAKRIRDESKRIAKITQDLLFYSKDSRADMKRVDVNETIDGALSLVATKIRNDGICLEIINEEDLPRLLMQPQSIQQVIINLVDNACDALRDKVAVTDQKTIRVHTYVFENNQSSYLCIEVYDNGIGMSEETVQKAQDAFFTTKPPSEGTGLGLSIVNDIIKRHDGRLEIDSKVGEYTKIKVIIPAITDSQD